MISLRHFQVSILVLLQVFGTGAFAATANDSSAPSAQETQTKAFMDIQMEQLNILKTQRELKSTKEALEKAKQDAANGGKALVNVDNILMVVAAGGTVAMYSHLFTTEMPPGASMNFKIWEAPTVSRVSNIVFVGALALLATGAIARYVVKTQIEVNAEQVEKLSEDTASLGKALQAENALLEFQMGLLTHNGK
jgi:hypothetical protein